MNKAIILAEPSKGYLLGGAENQLVQLAKELSVRNVEVTLVGQTEHESKNEHFDYIQIRKNWSKPAGWLQLFRVTRRRKAEVMITRVLNPLLPIYALICLLSGCRLMYFCAHDWELESRPDKRIKGWRWKMFWLGVQFTHTVFVQNKFQLKGFRKKMYWGKHRVLQTNNLPLTRAITEMSPTGPYFTWVGSYRPHKRPEWVIEMAERLPHIKFKIVMGSNKDQTITKKLHQEATRLNNLEFIPGVPREELIDVYRDAAAVLITSKGEGFPNVAIESWSQGRLVISTPNHALEELTTSEGVSICSDIDDFVHTIGDLKEDQLYSYGKAGLEYFKENFASEKIVKGILERFPAVQN